MDAHHDTLTWKRFSVVTIFLSIASAAAMVLSACGIKDDVRSLPRNPQVEQTALGKLRFLTYNVWGLPEPLLTDKTRFKDIQSGIPDLGADVIAFNETFTRNSHILAETKGYPFVAWGPSAQRLRRFSSGLLIISKHPILFTSTMVYSLCDGVDCLSRKGVLFARIRVDNVGEVDVFTTHMNAAGDDAGRAFQVGEMADFVQRHHNPALPLVLLGDFNFERGTAPDTLLSARLGVNDAHDEYVSEHPELTPYQRAQITSDPKTNSNVPAGNKPKRIDFCFFKSNRLRIETERSGMAFDTSVAQRFLSDHFAVLTDLAFY